MKKLLFCLMIITLMTTTTNYLPSTANAATGYTYSEQVTNVNLDRDDFNYSIVTNGHHIVWTVMSGPYEQIYYLDTNKGKVIQITDTKSRKGEPVVTETAEGIFIIWSDNYNFSQPGMANGGRDIFSYHLETKQITQLNQTSGPYYEYYSAYKNHVVWTSSEMGIVYYDLDSNKERTIGEGSEPIVRKNTIMFRNSGLVYYDLSSGEQKEIKWDTYLNQYAFNGTYLLAKEKIRDNAEYQLFDVEQPDTIGLSLSEEIESEYSKVLIGDTYGAWVEDVEGKVTVTGVDLLYKNTFSLEVKTTYDRILSFAGDQLVYMDDEDRLVYITIKPPLTSSIRTSEQIYVVIDGQEMTFNAPPVISNGTTMVEFRPIFEKLGFSIEWNNKTKTIIGKKDTTEIKLTIDSSEAVFNGKIVKLDQSPTIKYNYTYVPLRLIGEAADRKVTWSKESQTAFISPKDTEDTLYYEKGTIKYKGDLVDGKRHGIGAVYSEEHIDKIDYEGEWKNDKMDGKGRMYYDFSDNLFFEGTMVDGRQSEGVEYFPSGVARYKGNYKNGLQYNGIVTEINSNRVYIAELIEGRLNGKAIVYHQDGTIEFEGTFKGGVMAEGKLYDQDGKLIYEGEFDEKGQPEGAIAQ